LKSGELFIFVKNRGNAKKKIAGGLTFCELAASYFAGGESLGRVAKSFCV
jgi:hypothetical protein